MSPSFHFRGAMVGTERLYTITFVEISNNNILDALYDDDNVVFWESDSKEDLEKVVLDFLSKLASDGVHAGTTDVCITKQSDLRIIALKYNKRVVGYRLKGDDIGTVDISKEAAEKHGVSRFNITKVINLVESNETLISSSEKKSGTVYRDISTNDNLIDELFGHLNA